MPISKPDFNLIFASQAPSQDLPAAFNNYARGWDEARKNNGKPTIKQFNYLIQQLDLKALWMIQNGAALPFDETVDYAEGAFTIKDGSLQQFIGGVWKKPTQSSDQTFDASGETQQQVNYNGGSKWHSRVGGYKLNERVVLTNGDIVKSTVDGNTNDPNLDMTGWRLQQSYPDIWVNLVSDISNIKHTEVSQRINAKGFYTPNDGGGGDFIVVSVTSVETTDELSLIRISSDKAAKIIADEDGYVSVKRFGIKTVERTEVTDSIDYAPQVLKAFASGYNLKTDNYFKTTATIPITKTMNFKGNHMYNSGIGFYPSDELAPLFDFSLGGKRCNFEDFRVTNDSWKGVLCKETGNISASDNPSKNRFVRVMTYKLKRVAWFTTANPLLASSHAMCSENLFEGCKFQETKEYVLNENMQSLNNWFRNCDFENTSITTDDALNTYITDHAGGGLYFDGGSVIGKGRLYAWLYPAGGSGLFAGASFGFTNIRLECRQGHSGVLLEEGLHGQQGSLYLDLNIDNIQLVTFSQSLDLLRFAGRLTGSISNIKPIFSSSLYVRHYPTLGRSGDMTSGSFGGLNIDTSSIKYSKETTSPYGTYNPAYVSAVYLYNSQYSNTNTHIGAADTQGFRAFPVLDNKQFGIGYNNVASFGKIVLSSEHNNAQLSGTKLFKLPNHIRLLKLGLFANVYSKSPEVKVSLYIVKDVANWASSTFNIGTDAYLLGEATSVATQTGLVEVPLNTTLSTNLPADNKSGSGNWSEGRIAVVFNTSFVGFAYIEYV